MTITVPIPTTIRITNLKMLLPVKYGTEDIPDDFPGRDGDFLVMDIDIDKRRLIGWPSGKRFSFCMKVTDGGNYYLNDEITNLARVEGDYVPRCIPGGGDYVEMLICEDGTIRESEDKMWNPKPQDVKDSFFNRDDN